VINPSRIRILVVGMAHKGLRDLERFATRHHAALTTGLGIELRRPPSDSSFRYFFLHVDVEAICEAIRDEKPLRGSIEPAATGGVAFMAQLILYSAALGLAIVQTCYATGDNHERGVCTSCLPSLISTAY
jgi:hypothetical protein